MAKAAIGEGQREFRTVRCQYRHNQTSVLLAVMVVVVVVMAAAAFTDNTAV